MDYGSLFTGIGGFDLGFKNVGMSCKWQCENDPSASSVLEYQFPGVKNYHHGVESINYRIGKGYRRYEKPEPVDLICGGFPCQDVSIAGRRAGLAGERSGLWYEFHRILEQARPQWVVIENVPGLLSSNKGRDFATIIQGLAELRYGVAWRILDAQYFGVAQRRRRVFIVGSLGDGRAAQVLFERESGAWDTPPRREAGQGITGTLDRKSASSDRGSQANEAEFLAFNWQSGGDVRHDFNERPMIHSGQTPAIMAWHENKGGCFTPSDHMKALRSGASHSYQGVGVRRLTPTECERLQGFPDGWTTYGIDKKGKTIQQSDSARYRQLGNAVCVPVIEWIGDRIERIK